MLDAGIGIVNCLDILEKQSENKVLVKALGALYEDVQKGFTLSEGMKKNIKKYFLHYLSIWLKLEKPAGIWIP